MFLIIYCSLGSTFAYQQWFSACPCLTLPARHNLISFLLVLYSLLHLPVVSPICCLPVPLLYLSVIIRFPAFLPVPYFTCPSFSFPGPCLSFQSSYSSSSFPVAFFFRCWCRANRSSTKDCRATLASSALQSQLQSCFRGISPHWVEVCLEGEFFILVAQEEKLRIGRWLLLQRGFVGRHRASEPSFFLRA